MTSTHRELADSYLQAARHHYIEDGGVNPLMGIHGGPQELIVYLKPGDWHPSDQLCATAFGFGSVIEASILVTVTECWMKKFDPADQPTEDIQRGYLEQRHLEGDLAVHTALMVIVVDLKDNLNSMIRTLDVDDPSDEEINARTEKDLQLGSGSLLDRLIGAWDHGRSMGPALGDWPVVAGVLAKTDVIQAVVVAGPKESVDDLLYRIKRETS